MRRIFTVFAFFGCVIVHAQTFSVDTIFKNGGLNERINLVFVGDGYLANELVKYRADVDNILMEIFNQSPFKEYKNYFNAFAIKVISNQSGANHPRTSPDGDCLPVPVLTVDTYFGSTFDYASIHRLLAPTKISALSNVFAGHLPQYDQAFVVVNSSYYGGSGGHYATGSTHLSGKEVAIHEVGHSFGLLADEYWAGQQYAAEKPNLTRESNSTLIKWKNWLGINGIGIYPHSESTTWMRPHQSCKMRDLGSPFCNVCGEAFLERIHSLVQPLQSYSPTTTTLPLPTDEEVIDFSLTLIKPEPNSLEIVWRKNNVIFSNEENVSIPASSFMNQGAIIQATVIDKSTLTKSPTHDTDHVYVVEWTVGEVEEVVTDIQISSEESKYVITVFPNPIKEELNFSYTIYKPTFAIVSVFDVTGKKIKTFVKEKQLAGQHQYQLNGDVLAEPGEYILKFEFDKTVLTRKIIKQ